MSGNTLIYCLAAIACAALIAFSVTPAVRILAYKMGAIDIPKDKRRMHKDPVPRLGGLAIFAAFTLTTLIFCFFGYIPGNSGGISLPVLYSLWIGGAAVTVLGMCDDVLALNPWVKLLFQIAASCVPILFGLRISQITLGSTTIHFGVFSIPITLIWIVGLTNAVNLIDGLDGLSCGISAISSLSLFFISILRGDMLGLLSTAILTGSCLGFLPYNINPAKIFMGDTGALFLGYTLSVISIDGVFKMHALIAFLIPISLFALPLFDTLFAIVRRLAKGKSPFSADRGHIHHRLIDMGLSQKQTVCILYAICALFGVAAILFAAGSVFSAGILIIVAVVVLFVLLSILKNPDLIEKAGLLGSLNKKAIEEMKAEKNENEEEKKKNENPHLL